MNLLASPIYTWARSTNVNHVCCPEHELPWFDLDRRSLIVRRRLGKIFTTYTRAHFGVIDQGSLQC